MKSYVLLQRFPFFSCLKNFRRQYAQIRSTFLRKLAAPTVSSFPCGTLRVCAELFHAIVSVFAKQTNFRKPCNVHDENEQDTVLSSVPRGSLSSRNPEVRYILLQIVCFVFFSWESKFENTRK